MLLAMDLTLDKILQGNRQGYLPVRSHIRTLAFPLVFRVALVIVAVAITVPPSPPQKQNHLSQRTASVKSVAFCPKCVVIPIFHILTNFHLSKQTNNEPEQHYVAICRHHLENHGSYPRDR